MLCCTLRFSSKHLEGQTFLFFLIGFSGLNTVFMWITWLDRFSGNANFYFFQTFIFNLGFVFIFIQTYMNVNEKIIKYAKQVKAE